MFKWVRNLFGRSGTPPSSSHQNMSIEDLLRAPCKFNTKALTGLAHSASESEFVETVTCMSLVGSSIQNGEVLSLTHKGGAVASTRTMLFKSSDVSDIINETPLSETIFALRKPLSIDRPSSVTHLNVGRAVENDIRIVDFAISRFHARITISLGACAIADLKSRNGTRINGEALSTLPRELQDGDTIAFGRYTFTFMHPGSLYQRLRGVTFTE
jgi:hypothetical protein